MTAPERLSVETLIIDQTLNVQVGPDPLLIYRFQVRSDLAGRYPLCVLTQLDAEGNLMAGPATVLLEGSGRWTTREQNPVQTQDRALTPDYGGINVGSYLTVLDPNTRARAVLEPAIQSYSFAEQ